MRRSRLARLVLLVLLVLLSAGLILLPSCLTEVKAVEVPPPPAKVNIVVTGRSYEYGYVEMNGVVENVGTVPIFSLELELIVYNQAGDVTLATTTTWPAGCFLADLAPGSKVAFDFIVSVPGEPAHIKYIVVPADPEIEWDLEWPK